MTIRYDGYYRSGLIQCVNWHAGVRMTKAYFESLKFFDDGFCIRKNHRKEAFDFHGFLSGIDMDAIRKTYPQNDPVDDEYDAIYMTDRFEVTGNDLVLIGGHWLEMTTGREWLEWRGNLKIVSPEQLDWKDLHATYRFTTG